MKIALKLLFALFIFLSSNFVKSQKFGKLEKKINKTETQKKKTKIFEFEKFKITKGKIGNIKIGMNIIDAEKEIFELTKKQAEAFDFGFDGGGKAYIYSFKNEPILALIPKRDSKEIFAIIALNKNLKTENGLNPKSKISEIQNKYPSIKINQDLMMDWEYIFDKKNNWDFVFMTNGKNRIGEYQKSEMPAKPKKAESKMDWITIK